MIGRKRGTGAPAFHGATGGGPPTQAVLRPAPPRFRISPPEFIAVIGLVVFGLPFCLAIPLGAGTDEETHVIRSWEIASLHFIPNEVPRNELPFPAILWNLSYRRQVLIRPVPPDFFSDNADRPLDADGYIYSELPTRSVYSPPLLLPQALAIRYLGHKWHFPALTIYFASRVAGLLAYTLLVWLAVRWIPFGKWTLVVVALAPAAVFQAATIGADPISNGLAFVFTAGVLALAGRPSIGWKEFGGIVLLAALLFLVKPNLAFLALLPFLAISRSRFTMKGGYWILLLVTFLLGAIEAGGWALLAYPRLGSAPEAATPLAQLAFVLTHPGAFAAMALQDLLAHGGSYLQLLAGTYGYYYGVVPLPVFLLMAAAVLVAVLQDGRAAHPHRRTRSALVVVALIGVAATLLLMYLTANPVGSPTIEGVQARYFAPYALLGLLAAVGTAVPPVTWRLQPWTVGLLSVALVLFGAGLVLTYYIPCGQAYARPGLCYQPVYKNWDPNARYSLPVEGSFSLTQQILPECGGVSRVDVWVDGRGAATDGATTFILRDPDDDRDLARQTIPNTDLPTGGWVPLDVETDWRSEGSLYLLTIRPADGTGKAGPRVAYSLAPEYPQGDLFEAGHAVESDILFRYGCVAGWQKLLGSRYDSATTPPATLPAPKEVSRNG